MERERVMDRRGFLSALFKGTPKGETPPPLSLPYVADPSLLQKHCLACEAPCLSACEEGIITLIEGIPRLDISKRGCTFCQACALACPHGVLDPALSPRLEASVKIEVLKCLAWHGTLCYSCKEACEARAIKFLGLFHPEIGEACTACGACVSPCPVDAIILQPLSKERP